MGKIYYMMGKSSSGKDSLYKELRKAMPELRTVTLYTTRPAREGEQDGVEYHFVTDEALDAFEEEGRIIEERAYHTVQGIWRYATVDDGQIDLEKADYLVIGTLESYRRMRSFYGKEKLVPIYIEVEDGERLLRALRREQGQEHPGYAEMCRRFLADTADFSEEKLKELQIDQRFVNDQMTRCLEEIIGEIRHGKL